MLQQKPVCIHGLDELLSHLNRIKYLKANISTSIIIKRENSSILSSKIKTNLPRIHM